MLTISKSHLVVNLSPHTNHDVTAGVFYQLSVAVIPVVISHIGYCVAMRNLAVFYFDKINKYDIIIISSYGPVRERKCANLLASTATLPNFHLGFKHHSTQLL